ncbi:polysaccharide deacetylase family protein [Saccharothrix syringae]|uniref:polysaccharide deacetylase family protein n=1 Tax=Saccharothrix syringae TaxID=103733 RepID=UPI00068AF1DC|nr:polysaccharide deacetylase family protein [Saccharothrix syringae]
MNSAPTPSRPAALVLALVAAACAACSSGRAPVDQVAAPVSSARPAAASSVEPPDPAEVGANELGLVPVLMYHRLVERPVSVYDRTPAAFRAELERLAAENYVPVTATEYATGRMDVPAGRHPVVLTFDDGDPTQFALGPDGVPAPGTAVAILLEVAARHPGFRPVASLYVNAAPFGSADGSVVLPWLREHGFEVGNHTLDHTNLAAAGDAGVQEAIARGQREIQRALPDQPVTSLALPFGAVPANAELARRGAADGIAYEHACVLLVGAGPAPSPYSADFDPLAVPRIRSQDATGQEAAFGSSAWLDKLAADPAGRYTSDGVPERISHPAARGGVAAPAFADRVTAY